MAIPKKESCPQSPYLSWPRPLLTAWPACPTARSAPTSMCVRLAPLALSLEVSALLTLSLLLLARQAKLPSPSIYQRQLPSTPTLTPNWKQLVPPLRSPSPISSSRTLTSQCSMSLTLPPSLFLSFSRREPLPSPLQLSSSSL